MEIRDELLRTEKYTGLPVAMNGLRATVELHLAWSGVLDLRVTLPGRYKPEKRNVPIVRDPRSELLDWSLSKPGS